MIEIHDLEGVQKKLSSWRGPTKKNEGKQKKKNWSKMIEKYEQDNKKPSSAQIFYIYWQFFSVFTCAHLTSDQMGSAARGQLAPFCYEIY